MSEVGFLDHVYSSGAEAQASEQGLKLPTIKVEDKLSIRLARHDWQLDIDDTALLGGVVAEEIENPVTLHLGSLPKDATNAQPLLTHATSRLDLKISPNPVAKALPTHEMNTNFWLGLVVADQIAEGADSQWLNGLEQSRQKRRNQLKMAAGAFFAGDLTLGGVTGAFSATYRGNGIFSDVMQFALYGVAPAILTHATRKYGTLLHNTERAIKVVGSKKVADAADLAAEYPVLLYSRSPTAPTDEDSETNLFELPEVSPVDEPTASENL